MKIWFSCACYETDEEFEKMKNNLDGQIVEVTNNDEMSKFLGWLLIRIWSLYGITANKITSYKSGKEVELSVLMHDPQWILLQRFIDKNLAEVKDNLPCARNPLRIYVGPDMFRLVDFLETNNVVLLNENIQIIKDPFGKGSDMRVGAYLSKGELENENQKPE